MRLNLTQALFLVLSGCLVAIAGCKFNGTYINREEDNQIGMHYLSEFYGNVKKQDTLSIDKQASDTLTKQNGAHALGSFVHMVQKKLGNYHNYTVVDHYTSRIEGTNPQTVYKYKLRVNYDRDIADELIIFGQKDKDPVKIIGYNVQSKLFLK